MEYGFIIINKIDKLTLYFDKLKERKYNKNLSVSEILKKYKGFEGEFISLNIRNEYERNWGNISDFIKYRNYYLKLKKEKNNYLFLFLCEVNSYIPYIIKSNFTFIGYEYGYCDNEYNVFSSIFNEIIFGTIPELINYYNKLNEYLLFKDYKAVFEYSKSHSILYNNGQDVEDEDRMAIYKLWNYNITLC